MGSIVSEDPSATADQADRSIQLVSYENAELVDTLNSSVNKPHKLNLSQHTSRSDVSDPVLSGNTLTSEMKLDLQNKVRFNS